MLREYKVCSLKEFSLLLEGYNVKAEHIQGKTKSGEFEGMVYSATSERGRRLGRPIKASSFASKPTLAHLQKVFEENREAKREAAALLQKAIEKESMRQLPVHY